MLKNPSGYLNEVDDSNPLSLFQNQKSCLLVQEISRLLPGRSTVLNFNNPISLQKRRAFVCFESNACSCSISVTHICLLTFYELSILQNTDVGRGLEASLSCRWLGWLPLWGGLGESFFLHQGLVWMFTAADAERSLNDIGREGAAASTKQWNKLPYRSCSGG